MRSKFVPAIVSLICLGSLVVLGSSTTVIGNLLESVNGNSFTKVFSSASQSAPAQSFENNPALVLPEKPAPVKEVPQTVLWHMIFSLSRMTEQEAKKLNQQGRNGDAWSQYFIKRGVLSAASEKTFKQTAAAYLKDLEPIDRRAKEVTDAMRAEYPKGLIKDPKNMPLPPAELGALQQQKNALVLRHRDAFKNAVSPESFNKFSDFLTKDFSKSVAPVNYPHPNQQIGKRKEVGDEK
jgi:hypothetical protein